jgi:hypothetical protein
MRYFHETERFLENWLQVIPWKILVLHGWPKKCGQVNDFVSKGVLSPESANIDFAVPSIQTL